MLELGPGHVFAYIHCSRSGTRGVKPNGAMTAQDEMCTREMNWEQSRGQFVAMLIVVVIVVVVEVVGPASEAMERERKSCHVLSLLRGACWRCRLLHVAGAMDCIPLPWDPLLSVY